MPLTQTTVHLADEEETARLGAALAHAIERQRAAIEANGLVIGLTGDLGAGKTSLVRGVLRALGVTGPVKSPTFALLEPYVVSSLDFYHFDFYRFADPDEFAAVGFRELFGAGSVCAIEWPERAGDLPTPDLALTLRVEEPGRRVQIAAHSELGVACLNDAIRRWETPTAAAG
ncbi:MAG: tRNA (adenosine(37)-N6)-threonylcarbamoyltransferase complex ATPase subunit type 1 TsaE [Gemmatimonadota bacterium]